MLSGKTSGLTPGRTAVLIASLSIVGPPVAIFLWEAAAGLASGGAFWEPLFSWGLFARSVSIAAASAAVASVIGAFAGMAAGRLSRRAAALMLFVFVVPLAAPAGLHAYVWRNVALSAGLLGDFFVEGGRAAVNVCGAVLSLVSAYWTIPALAAFAVTAGAGKRYEVEARPFAPAGVAARRVLLALVVPAVAAAGGLVFVLSFGDYSSAPLWQINTYPVEILSLYTVFYEPRMAAAAALVPSAVTGLAAAATFLAAGRALSRADVDKAQVDRQVLWRPGAIMKCALGALVAALVGMPLATSAYWTWKGGLKIGEVLSAAKSFGGTLAVAAAAAAAAALLAALVAAAGRQRRGGWDKALVLISLAAFLLPAAGVGHAVKAISQWRAVPESFASTTAAFGYALAGRFFAVPLVLCAAAAGRIDKRYRDLVEISGVRRLWRLFVAYGPFVVPAAAAGLVVATDLGISELPIAVLAAPPGAQPISMHLSNLMHYAHQGEAFAAALAMMLGASAVVTGALGVTWRIWKRYLPSH